MLQEMLLRIPQGALSRRGADSGGIDSVRPVVEHQ